MNSTNEAKAGADAVVPIARNRRARFDYHVLDTYEAGLVLTGTEVKSLRARRAALGDAYAVVKNGELWLVNLHIATYDQGNQFNHDPTRTRKLLLHAREIRRLVGALEREGLTLVPLELYFRRGRVKVRLGLGRGKKVRDKREAIRAREERHAIARVRRSGSVRS